MLEVIAFGFQGVVVLVFNLPPAAPGGNHLHDVGILYRMRGGKRIVVHHLTIQGGGRELTPIHHQGVVSVPQRHRTNIPIGIDLMAFASPPFTDPGFNAAATLQNSTHSYSSGWDWGLHTRMNSNPCANNSRQKGSWQYRSSPSTVTPKEAYSLPQRPNQRLAALISPSCFAWPSWGRTNSGASGITLSQPGLTTTGVSTEWKYITEPLAWCWVEQYGQ